MNAPAHPSRLLKFSPEIEGLRAIAIFVVVFCHAGFPGFQGGFIGVDIFFVLSGYLITGLLIDEASATGSINFAAFYGRRLRRLLPALLLVTLATLVMAGILLAPFEQFLQAQTIKAVPLWITNFHFSFSDVDYFAPESGTNLFLHTWSLAVEEQFYLIWPVFILWLVAGKPMTALREKLPRIIEAFTVTIGLTFVLCLFLSFNKPLWGFYLMPARMWEFGIGGLVFVLANLKFPEGILPASIHRMAGWAGALLLLGGVLFLTESRVYPGYWALVPAIGTALMLFGSASTAPSAINKMLSQKPMQSIGKLSYSWYLWHWPVLILGNVVLSFGSMLQNLALVCISLMLAWLTLIAVEAPVRHSTWLRKPALTISISLALMLGVFVLGGRWQEKAVEWTNLDDQAVFQQIRNDMPVIYSMGCDDWYATPRLRVCGFGNQDAEKTAVLLGDSIGAQWFTALAAPKVRDGWRFVVLTKSSCPIVDEPIFYERIGMEYIVCSDWRTAALAYLQELKPDMLFLGSASSYAYSEAEWYEGTRRVLDVMAPVVDSIYIIQGSHVLPFDGPGCLARKNWQPAVIAMLSDCSAARADRGDVHVAAALDQAAAAFANVYTLDLNPLICPNGRCNAQAGGRIVFRDTQHLANSYIESVTTALEIMIANSRTITH